MAGTSRRSTELAGALGGWLFLLAVVGLYGIGALYDPRVVADALTSLRSLLVRVLPVLLLVFGLLFLANLLVRKSWLASHLGRESGFSGWVLAIGCGVLSVGPVSAWYPLLGELKDKGTSGALIAAFLYGRALKLPLLPLMVHYFGVAYTVVLSVCIVAFSVLSGKLMRSFGGLGTPERDGGLA